MNANTKGSLILILCSFVWGMAFTAQSAAAGVIGAFTFVFLRFAISSIVLFSIYPLLRKKDAPKMQKAEKKRYLILFSESDSALLCG